MTTKVTLQCADEQYILEQELLQDSVYFQALLSGKYQNDTHVLQLDSAWQDQLPNYVHFLEHKHTFKRVTGDDYELAMYLQDQPYIDYCVQQPHISNKVHKHLRRNYQCKQLYAVLDGKSIHRKVYFAEFTDQQIDLIIQHWPSHVPTVEIAREWHLRQRTLHKLPKKLKAVPSYTHLLNIMERTAMWAYWWLQSLLQFKISKHNYGRRRKHQHLGKWIAQYTSNFDRDTKLTLQDLQKAPVDEIWLLEAVVHLKRLFADYQLHVNKLLHDHMEKCQNYIDELAAQAGKALI